MAEYDSDQHQIGQSSAGLWLARAIVIAAGVALLTFMGAVVYFSIK